MAPPTQRPFFANFLAAFRAHSAATAAVTSSTSPTTSTSNPRSLSTKPTTTTSTPSTLTAATSQQQNTSQSQVSPSERPHPRAGERLLSPSLAAAAARRRGSDSSSSGSEGFRDVQLKGGEKWYIGGRTAQGEERYYKLGVVRRQRSGDRLSLDRLSL